MVEFSKFKSEIPSLTEDVRKFTSDLHGLVRRNGEKLPLEPYLYEEDKFYDKLSKLGLSELSQGRDAAFISPDDGNINLNYDELNDELYRERTVAILSRFAPYQFVLYETNYGNWLREETKKAIEKEGWERIKTLGSDVLEGICRAFEKDALETIKGYEFDEIKKRLREDLEEVSEEVREGYELYGKLKEKAEDFVRRGHELVEETHTREKIFKASLLVASRDKYFESNYRELISWPVEKLYAMAGEYSPVEVCDPRIEAEDIQELARNIDYMETHSEQMWHITPKLEELKEKLETKGYKELADKVNEHLNACYKKEELENFPDDLKDDGMNLMKEIIEELEKAKKRPIKITSW